MTTLYFFGDSWSSEYCEIEKLVASKQIDLDQPLKSYPTMVGTLMGLPIKNLSQSGSSQSSLIEKLLQSNMSTGDHAVFSLTAPSRRMYYNDQGQSINTFTSTFKEALNDYDDSWQSALTCYTLYKLCQEKSVNCWFISTFNISYNSNFCHPLWDYVPDSAWLIPKDNCAVQTEFDPEFFNRYQDYKNSDFYEWLNTNNNQVHECIRPCNQHPNLHGRERIANKIACELKKRIK
jgi:hypothetical protein